ncbi:NAD-dependent epimerase/dehydratase family protein [Candidatus Falkowbacteria bacterium]|nr:NAD-dependent epimerase/dehydratase family protein [Candidatus Falkowbacteria bacterium]
MAIQTQFKKNVLVLGGAGFIGSHLCDDLVKIANVICVDSFISSDPLNIEHLLALPNFEFIRADINDVLDLENIPELEKFDIKFHGLQEVYNLAVPTSPKNFNQFKAETAITNTQGTINALNIALKYRSKFLQFSSSVVYGMPTTRGVYVEETSFFPVDPLSPNGVYDEGKRVADTLVMTYREKYNLDAKIIRIFRTYGPRMPLFEGHMIPDFIVNALNGEPLVIFGSEQFETSLVYVDDVISACHKVMMSPHAGPYNVGNPLSYKLADVAKKIITMTQSTSKIEYQGALQFMRELALPNISKIKKEIDWFPVMTLDKGLEKTIEYTRAHKILVKR